MKTLTFDTTGWGMIEINFDPTTGDGKAYFYKDAYCSTMRNGKFHNKWNTEFNLIYDGHKKVATIEIWLPQTIGKITF